MKPIVAESIEAYLRSLIPDRDPVLSEMEEIAERDEIPIVGPLVGRLLYLIVTLTGARRVLELGSAIGYSTLWLAKGVGEGGEVIFTDWGEENAARAKKFFRRAGVDRRIEIHTGEALEIVDRLEGEFDLIFNDVDKHFYPKVFEKAIPRLRTGGVLVSDNALWSGRVAEPGGDEWTRGVREYNRLIHETPGLLSTILPIRDGVSVTVRLGDG